MVSYPHGTAEGGAEKAGPQAHQDGAGKYLYGRASGGGYPQVQVERAPKAHRRGGSEEKEADNPRLEEVIYASTLISILLVPATKYRFCPMRGRSDIPPDQGNPYLVLEIEQNSHVTRAD